MALPSAPVMVLLPTFKVTAALAPLVSFTLPAPLAWAFTPIAGRLLDMVLLVNTTSPPAPDWSKPKSWLREAVKAEESTVTLVVDVPVPTMLTERLPCVLLLLPNVSLWSVRRLSVPLELTTARLSDAPPWIPELEMVFEEPVSSVKRTAASLNGLPALA